MSLSKEDIIASQLKWRTTPPVVTVEYLSQQISTLTKTTQAFQTKFQNENTKNIADLKKSIQDIAGVVPRVDTLETNYKKLDKAINSGKLALKSRVSTLESEVEALHGYDKSVKKVQEGFKGLELRLQTVEKFVKSSKQFSTSSTLVSPSPSTEVLSDLKGDVSQLRSSSSAKWDYVTGWMDKVHFHQATLQSQTDFTLFKSMQCELCFGGIAETKKENCKLKILDFLQNKVKITVQVSEILSAFQVGKKSNTDDSSRPRHLLAKVVPQLKERIMKNAKNLKGQVDPQSKGKCFVTVNEPEAYKSARQKFHSVMDAIREANASRHPTQKIKMRLVGRHLFINNKPFVEVIQPPCPSEVLSPVEIHDEWMDKLTFLESAVHRVQGNVFRGYAIHVSKLHSVHLTYCKLRSCFPSSDHILMAYKIPSAAGSCDDGEYFGDLQIADSIASQNRNNVAVFIVRSSGRKLGMKRFDIFKCLLESYLPL